MRLLSFSDNAQGGIKFQREAVVLVGYEMKAIDLVDWTIDAPVGNNLCILFCGRNGYAENANNQFCGEAEKSAITRVASASRPYATFVIVCS